MAVAEEAEDVVVTEVEFQYCACLHAIQQHKNNNQQANQNNAKICHQTMDDDPILVGFVADMSVTCCADATKPPNLADRAPTC